MDAKAVAVLAGMSPKDMPTTHRSILGRSRSFYMQIMSATSDLSCGHQVALLCGTTLKKDLGEMGECLALGRV